MRTWAERRRRVAVAGVALVLAACATLSVEEERDLGAEMSRQIQAELVFLRDPVVVHYVEDIGERIVRASGSQNFDYRFYVVDDDQINAFAMPAGHVYVNTETILKARNVSELAGVMAHEVGHVVERHIAENYNRQRTAGLLQQFGVVAAGVTLGQAGAGAANILGGLSAMAVINSFGRDAEREADAFAVKVMPEAGFHPSGIVTFFETLRAEGGAGAPSFLSSHPATEERIANTTSLIRARELPPGLRHEDGGRLEIIQRRIRLLTGRTDPEER